MILCSSYSSGAQYCELFNLNNKKLIVNGRLVEFDVAKNLFSEEICNDLPELDITNFQESLVPVKKVNLIELDEILSKYKIIAADEEYFSLIASILPCNYYEQLHYKESFEGIMWEKIMELEEDFCSSEDFSKLEFLKLEKINKNAFPYINYSYLKYEEKFKFIKKLVQEKKYKELFKFFTGNEPLYEFDLENFEKIFLKKHVGKYLLINKSLVKFFKNEEIVFLGKSASEGVSLHLLYEPTFEPYKIWEDKKIILKIENEKQKILYENAEFEKLELMNEKIKDNSQNLYLKVKQLAIQEIKARLLNRRLNSEWKEFLINSGLETLKILQKAEQLIANFFLLYEKYDYKFQFDYYLNEYKFDFGFPEEKIFADFFWSTPDSNTFFHKVEFLKTQFDFEYYVISTQKIKKIEEVEFKVPKKTKINNLHYWVNNLDYINNT